MTQTIETKRLPLAKHEATHAVIAVVCGIEVTSASAGPDGAEVRFKWNDDADSCAAATLAPAICEARLNGSADILSFVGEVDTEALARRLSIRRVTSAKSGQRFLRQATRDVVALLADNSVRAAILEVASRLLKVRQLSGDEIRAIVGRYVQEIDLKLRSGTV